MKMRLAHQVLEAGLYVVEIVLAIGILPLL